MSATLTSTVESRTDIAVTIRLTQGQFALIDVEDLDRVCAFKWTAYWTKWGWYAASRRGGKNLFLHRFVLNAPPDRQVDHENSDGLDCRKQNLRLATNGQNGANRKKQAAPCSSRFKGVDRHRDKWRARVRKDGVQETIGHFDSEEDAGRAYDLRARELHGGRRSKRNRREGMAKLRKKKEQRFGSVARTEHAPYVIEK